MTESRASAATLPELVRSWSRWVGTAEAVGEDALATRLVVAAPADTLDPVLGDVVLGRSAVLRGRPQDAVDQLQHVQLRAPADARAVDVVAAAARAATSVGVDDYRWLLAHVSLARGVPGSSMALRLLAAAADARGDTATADRAWEELVMSTGLRTPTALARLASTIITRRDPLDRRSVAAYAIEAASVGLLAAPRSTRTEVGAVVEAASSLAERGDRAGALVLLQTVRSLTRITGGTATAQALDAAQKAILPSGVRRTFAAGRAGVAMVGAALGLVATLATDGAAWLLIPLLMAAGAILWNRLVRLGPFTPAERRAWRALAHARTDGASGQVVGPQRDALGALLAVLGAFVGTWAGAVSALWAADRFTGTWAWLPVVTFVLVAPLPATVLLVLLGKARVALERRAHRRRIATEDRLVRSTAGQCACWDTTAVLGRGSVDYLERHLIAVPSLRDAERALTAVGSGAATARCPLSGILWLIVPSIPGEVLLMKGDMSTHEVDPSEEDALFF